MDLDEGRVLLSVDGGREVWGPRPKGRSRWIATVRGPEDPDGPAMIMVDDDRPLGSFWSRKLVPLARDQLRIYHCESGKAFHALLKHLRLRGELLVAVSTDNNTGDACGMDTLAFLADAPTEACAAGVQLRALPRLIMTAFGGPGLDVEAARLGHTYFDKPVATESIAGWLRGGAQELAATLRADLAAAGANEVVQGAAAWGPRPLVEHSADRLEALVANLVCEEA